jgi:hypothetical protein
MLYTLHTTQSCSQGQSTHNVAASVTTQWWKLPQKFMSHPCSFLRITTGYFTLEFQAFMRLTSSFTVKYTQIRSSLYSCKQWAKFFCMFKKQGLDLWRFATHRQPKFASQQDLAAAFTHVYFYLWFLCKIQWRILRPPGGSVSQTIVFRYKEIGDIQYCARNIGKSYVLV